MNSTASLESSVEQSNFHHLVQNTVWFGLATPATARFLSVYAIHVGATPFQLGLIASLGIGEALVTGLNSRGVPTPVVAARLVPPTSRMAPLTPEESAAIVAYLDRHYGK